MRPVNRQIRKSQQTAKQQANDRLAQALREICIGAKPKHGARSVTSHRCGRPDTVLMERASEMIEDVTSKKAKS